MKEYTKEELIDICKEGYILYSKNGNMKSSTAVIFHFNNITGGKSTFTQYELLKSAWNTFCLEHIKSRCKNFIIYEPEFWS